MKELSLDFQDEIKKNQGGHLVLIDVPAGIFFGGYSSDDLSEDLEATAADNGGLSVSVFDIEDRRDNSFDTNTIIAAGSIGGGIPGFCPAVKPIFNVASGALSPDQIALYSQAGLKDRDDLLFQAYQAAYENDPATIVTGVIVKKGDVEPGTTVEKVISHPNGQNLLAKWHVVSADNVVEGILNAVRTDAKDSLSGNEVHTQSDSKQGPVTGLAWAVPTFKPAV